MARINTVYFITFKSFANDGITRKEKKQKYSLFAIDFVKRKAAEILNTTPDSIAIEKGKNGKPFLKNYPRLFFNISHTDGAVAVAFSDSEVGVDTERIRKVNLGVSERFFTKDEKLFINGKTSQKNRRFFEIWTKKEALIKRFALTLSHLKTTQAKHIHTFQRGNFIISVSSESEKSILITLENTFDM